jgi:integrase
MRASTQADYEWQLTHHLLPFFRHHRLSQITVAEVDRYRQSKVDAGKPLSATSINKTITRLGQVLDLAVERELIARNPAKVGGRRRRLKAVSPRRAYLDRAEQICALLAAAGELDAEQKSNGRMHRRALLATLVFAGLRISELIALDWRDVDLQVGRLRVRRSKTDAGIRYV